MVDRVRARKFESPESGGTQTDEFPTGLDPNEDYLDVRGITVQNDTSNDETVLVDRDASDNLTFTDPVTGSKTLAELSASSSGISESSHRTLKQLIHFISMGPTLGFVSGAYMETLPAANPFPTQVTWWESSSKLKKIVSLDVTRNANKSPSVETWKMYGTDGTTTVETVADTITYSGIFELSRTRAIS